MGRHKYPCGSIIPSSCVPFTGNKPKFLTEELECDVNLDEVIDVLGDKIDELVKATDVSLNTSTCITIEGDKTPKNILQAHDNKLCELATAIEQLENDVSETDIASQQVTIDLGCLSAAASPCAVGVNTYTLIAVLNLFKTEICNIKSTLTI